MLCINPNSRAPPAAYHVRDPRLNALTSPHPCVAYPGTAAPAAQRLQRAPDWPIPEWEGPHPSADQGGSRSNPPAPVAGGRVGGRTGGRADGRAGAVYCCCLPPDADGHAVGSRPQLRNVAV